MSIAPSTLPRFDKLVHVRPPRVERGLASLREPQARLSRIEDAALWQAAVLGLMLAPDSARERAAWHRAVPDAQDLQWVLDDVLALPHSHRLPWLEHFARLLAPGPAAARHDLIDASRRVMTADGRVTPMDQLRWVALRHLLAGSAVSPPMRAPTELNTLNDEQAYKVCIFSAFLSRLVPVPEVELDPTGADSPNEDWYALVTAPWNDRHDLYGQPFGVPLRKGHDIDASLRALRGLQALPWLLRPVLVRSWHDAARVLTEGPLLHAEAADALRLACVLLDSPVPPELGRQYIAIESART